MQGGSKGKSPCWLNNGDVRLMSQEGLRGNCQLKRLLRSASWFENK